jgi:DNA-binding NtrC family response regulator
MVPAIAPIATGRQLNVLIASERETLTRVLSEALRAQGCRPIIQETGSSASDALINGGADVVVIDSDLPGVQWEAVRSAIGGERAPHPEPLDAVEKRHIAATLRFTRGNRRNAAQILGIARSTLLAKIRKYGLDNEH